jgi:hypothetical protein
MNLYLISQFVCVDSTLAHLKNMCSSCSWIVPDIYSRTPSRVINNSKKWVLAYGLRTDNGTHNDSVPVQPQMQPGAENDPHLRPPAAWACPCRTRNLFARGGEHCRPGERVGRNKLEGQLIKVAEGGEEGWQMQGGKFISHGGNREKGERHNQ